MNKIYTFLFILIVLFSGCIQTETIEEPVEITESEITESVQENIVTKNYKLDLKPYQRIDQVNFKKV